MDKMKLNNNDITVVPRFIDESMLPTVESIKQDKTHSTGQEAVSTSTTTNTTNTTNATNDSNKSVGPSKSTNPASPSKTSGKSEEKWYLKYKWYIIAAIVMVVVTFIVYYYFNSKPLETPVVSESSKKHKEKVNKKIRSNIIHDNESIASDQIFSKRLDPIEEEEDFDSPKNGVSDSDDKVSESWIQSKNTPPPISNTQSKIRDNKWEYDYQAILNSKKEDNTPQYIPPSVMFKSVMNTDNPSKTYDTPSYTSPPPSPPPYDKYKILDNIDGSEESVKSVKNEPISLNDELEQSFYDDQKSVEDRVEYLSETKSQNNNDYDSNKNYNSIDDLLV